MYLMDYKFITIKSSEEDGSYELGKINFYIVNKKHKYME